MRPTRARHRGLAVGAIALTVLAALLWARLKLVTGLPRSAYAEPEGASGSAHAGGVEK
ncbi:MAG: hypothetical protein ACKVU4_00210 [Phycisphaerales bacterium]